MGIILISIICYIIFIVLLGIGALKYAEFLLNQIVGKRHSALEQILSSRDIPFEWLKLKKNSKKNIENLSKTKYLRKLSSLITYVKSTTLIKSEKERNETLYQLDDIYKEWNSSE